MSGRGDDAFWRNEDGSVNVRILRENMPRIVPKRKATQRSEDHEKTRENRNMGEIDDMRKAQVELEELFGIEASALGPFTMPDGTTVVPHEGVKFDTGKRRVDLVPTEAINALADVLTAGAAKYGENNWRHGMDWSRVYGAAQRHMLAFWGGDDIDPESGMPHLWHAMTNLAFLVSYQALSLGRDDRWTMPGGEDE